AGLWRNLSRIARAVEILHGHGLAHRNLNRWSILTAESAEPDFQLTGHEWSMRILQPEHHPEEPREALQLTEHAFARDWRAFGLLAGELMRVEGTAALTTVA